MKISILVKKIVQLSFLGLLLLLCENLQAQGVSTQTHRIHPSDQINSNNFIALVGADRIIEFRLIENLIKPSNAFDGPAPEYDYFIGDYKLNESDLTLLLGQPDLKIADCMWQYNLTTSGCFALIGLDEQGLVSYISLKNCH